MGKEESYFSWALEGTKKSKAALAWAGGGTAGSAGRDSSTAAPEAEHSTLRKKPNWLWSSPRNPLEIFFLPITEKPPISLIISWTLSREVTSDWMQSITFESILVLIKNGINKF